MMYKRGRLFRAFIVAVLACVPALAQAEAPLAGLATYTDTSRDIYIAGLRTADGIAGPDPAALARPASLEYRIAIRRISARGFFGTLLLQAELGAGERAPDSVLDALSAMRKRVSGFLQAGDHFTITIGESGVTRFVLDGSQLYESADEANFNFIAQGWLGENASALLREPLISGEFDGRVRMRFDELVPPSGREKTVAAWVAPKPAPAGAVAAAARPAPSLQLSAPPPDQSAVAATVSAARPGPVPEPVETAAEAPAAEQLADATTGVPAAEATETPASESPASEATQAAAEAEPLLLASQGAGGLELVAMRETSAAQEAEDDREYQRHLRQYMTNTLNSVFRKVTYPRRALERGLQGEVELLARVNADGQLLEVDTGASSGYTVLDRAAVDAVKKAAPFPALGRVEREEFRSDDGRGYEILIPVSFRLRESS